MTIYLDHNATAPLLSSAHDAMLEWLERPANASSVHSYGRAARTAVEKAREQVAALIGATPRQVIFCASGSEANHWALHHAFPDRRLLVSAIEHPSILKTALAKGAQIIPVDHDGLVRLDALEAMLAADTAPALVSIMHANNETGVLQPIADIAELVHQHNGLLHTDAAQSAGRIAVDFHLLGADLMTLCAHKMGGPCGAAALTLRLGLDLPPLFLGGGQERNKRAGTENVAALAGFGAAAEYAVANRSHMDRLRLWRDAFEATLEKAVPDTHIYSKEVERLPNTSCIAMPDLPAETQLMHFDLAGVAVSAGAACTSGKTAPSHVLRAMGAAEKDAARALRISAGWQTTQEDYQQAAEVWLDCHQRAQANRRHAA